ncbi:MAG: hypothetical protein JWO56_1799 [Acidobacteria bacterium]|nr:hypothetical protein [Acidobacteriota bacterium]
MKERDKRSDDKHLNRFADLARENGALRKGSPKSLPDLMLSATEWLPTKAEGLTPIVPSGGYAGYSAGGPLPVRADSGGFQLLRELLVEGGNGVVAVGRSDRQDCGIGE